MAGFPRFLSGALQDAFASLSLPTVPLQGLRGAGASTFYMHTEDAMRCMRRGRWAELATMNIYLQEAEASLVMPRLSPQDRDRLETMAALSAWLLRASLSLLGTRLPPARWTQAFASLAAACAGDPGGAGQSGSGQPGHTAVISQEPRAEAHGVGTLPASPRTRQ